MTTTIDYLQVSEQISHALKARELHELKVEIGHFGFSPAEVKALREKVSARFAALNAEAMAPQPGAAGAARQPYPQGRFTLAPRTNASVLHLLGK